MKVSAKKDLVSIAKSNTTVKSGNSSRGFTITKEGTPLDHQEKQKSGKLPLSERTIGISKGITKNMENYESLRVDCWLTDTLKEGETVSEAFNRLSAVVDEALEQAVNDALA